jgi:hypothetical protein
MDLKERKMDHGENCVMMKFTNLYSSPNIVRVIKSRIMMWVGHEACMGKGRGVYKVLVGRPECKRPLGRPRRRWEHNAGVEEIDG